MKTRLLWLAILAVGLPALYFGITQPNVSSIPSNVRESISDLRPVTIPPLEPPALLLPVIPLITPPAPKFDALPMRLPTRVEPLADRPEVPIQDRSTIDFSTGFPQVKSFGKDQDALDTALKEISESVKGATFEAKK